MKKITMYQASNGAVFETEQAALNEEVRNILIDSMANHTHQGETFKVDAAREIMARLDVRLIEQYST